MTHPPNSKENCHCFPSRLVCACIIPASRAGWSQWLQGSKAGKTPTWGNSRQGPACSCFPLLPASPLTCPPALLAKKLPAAGETGSDLSCLVKNTSVSLTLEVVVNKPICENVSTVEGPFHLKHIKSATSYQKILPSLNCLLNSKNANLWLQVPNLAPNQMN